MEITFKKLSCTLSFDILWLIPYSAEYDLFLIGDTYTSDSERVQAAIDAAVIGSVISPSSPPADDTAE